MICGYNKKLGCKPPPNLGNTSKIINGVAQSEHRSSMTVLEVVFGLSGIPAGSKIYIPTQTIQNHPWGSAKHMVAGTEVILVPEELVVLVDFVDPTSFTGTVTLGDGRIVLCGSTEKP